MELMASASFNIICLVDAASINPEVLITIVSGLTSAKPDLPINSQPCAFVCLRTGSGSLATSLLALLLPKYGREPRSLEYLDQLLYRRLG
jgi:hypothetical protein